MTTVLSVAQMPATAEMREPQPRLTPDHLAQCWRGVSIAKAAAWTDVLNPAMEIFAINTPLRVAAFLAQCGHESGRGKWVREIWGSSPAQLRYERDPNEPWSSREGGLRHRNSKPFELGNSQPGDGRRYLGRGLIQTTGRSNYARTRNGLRAYLPDVPDFEAMPELLELPKWAAYSAAWFWANHGLNTLADGEKHMEVTRRINGGLTGFTERLALYAQACEALGVTA